jgi:hypothetical protein
MERANIVLIVMSGWCGILCLLGGYLFKQNQSVEMLSLPGLWIDKVRDKEGLSRFIGNRLMLIGVIAIFTSLSMALLPQFLMITILLFIFSGVTICIELAINKKRYLQKY